MLLSSKKIDLVVLILMFGEFAYAQKHEIDSASIKEVLTAWNEAHNEVNEDAFTQLYAPTALFYTNYLPKKACIEKKQSLLSRQPFAQRIVSDLELTFYEDGVVYCGFTKEVTTATGKKNYPSYLLLKRKGDRYVITGESDLITDRNLNFHLSLGPQIPISELSSTTFKKNIWPPNSSAIWVLVTIVLASAGGAVIYLIKRRPAHNKANEEQVRQNKLVSVPQNENASSPTQENKTTPPHKTFDVESLWAKLASPKKSHAKQSGHRNIQLAKGHTFEEFVVNRFRQKSDVFKWMDATSDKGVQGYYPESNLNPDLQYEFRTGGAAYAFGVECKFRTAATGTIQITNDGQIERYKRFSQQKKMEVFIVLGLGGRPDKPTELFVIPLPEAQQMMERSELNAYKALPSFHYDVAKRRLY